MSLARGFYCCIFSNITNLYCVNPLHVLKEVTVLKREISTVFVSARLSNRNNFKLIVKPN